MRRTVARIVVALVFSCPLGAAGQQADAATFPARVLITNDNGIEDPKLIALARAFARVAEVWVVAPANDRSGTGSSMSILGSGVVATEPRELGANIRAFAVSGFPADCVIVALLGLMRDARPDLVVSGINGGANLGADWFGSGTIGAARTAAIAGVPAIAVSGLDDAIPGAVDAAVEWVVRLAGSDAVRRLDPPEFLTVSIPRVAPDSVRGIRVVDRAPLRLVPRLEPAGEGTWRVTGWDELTPASPALSDEAVWSERLIAIVPMRADEVDFERLTLWRRSAPGLPAWR